MSKARLFDSVLVLWRPGKENTCRSMRIWTPGPNRKSVAPPCGNCGFFTSFPDIHAWCKPLNLTPKRCQHQQNMSDELDSCFAWKSAFSHCSFASDFSCQHWPRMYENTFSLKSFSQFLSRAEYFNFLEKNNFPLIRAFHLNQAASAIIHLQRLYNISSDR